MSFHAVYLPALHKPDNGHCLEKHISVLPVSGKRDKIYALNSRIVFASHFVRPAQFVTFPPLTL